MHERGRQVGVFRGERGPAPGLGRWLLWVVRCAVLAVVAGVVAVPFAVPAAAVGAGRSHMPWGGVGAAAARGAHTRAASGGVAYVADHVSGTVSVIDTGSNTVTATIPVGTFPESGVVVAPDGAHAYVTTNTAYVTNTPSGTVSVIDTSSNTVTATVNVGTFPWGVAVAPDGAHAYVANGGSGTVSVIDTGSNTVTATIPVGPDPIGVAIASGVAPTISGTPPAGTVGAAYSFQFTLTGAPAPTTTVTSGTLPTGLTLSTTGLLSGIPTQGGSFPITVTARNTTGSATDTFTLTVNQAPAITSADAATFTTGAAGTFKVTSTGVPTPALTETGTLPAGVTFLDSHEGTATLAGTPAAGGGGTYPITITASNGVTPDATQTFTLTVDQAPVITSAASTTFTAGAAGSFKVTSTGVPTPALSESGALPSGVSFTDNHDGTATLVGTPAVGTGGTYPITIAASNGVAPDSAQAFTLTVEQAAAPTGTVTYYDGTTNLGTATLNAASPNQTNRTTRALAHTAAQASTTTTVTAAPPSPWVSGQPVTFTATVSPMAPGASPARASFTTSALTVGSHSITAVYNGDADFTGSTSPAVPYSVTQAGSATTMLSAQPATERRTTAKRLLISRLSATLTSNSRPLSGRTITFTNTTATTRLCTATTNRHGVATCTTTITDTSQQISALARDLETHGYLATFAGDTTHTGSHAAATITQGSGNFSPSDLPTATDTDPSTQPGAILAQTGAETAGFTWAALVLLSLGLTLRVAGRKSGSRRL